ncbi:restriction endonuclease subunit S [Aliivibrio fischeri]|uniref:restriction endonuclease subunit S n=1 Tax=Aliivibrio fischeri TaxID=668 RepID=UPI0012D8B45D|nr:restriction endonuclease subunit S [Aliivibrio fischeri]MUH94997.1 restriction endonuclease subunit S [Aliivibrio fischeri]MUI65315.1 restriction endonuclease subunit S [Aliivibrio fischeri]
MGSERGTIPLGTLCSKVLTGGTPLTKNKEFYENGTIPWLKTKEVNFNFITETENYISELGLDGSSAKLVPKNSVIVAMYGQGDTAGRVAINKIPLTTNQACCNLVVDSAKADYRFVYYYLKYSYAELVRRKTGSAQPNLNTSILKEFEIVDFSLKEQIKIGDLLEEFDKKIILNRQINQTLEQMAQTLFKSWFVDFDPVIDNALDAIANGQDIEVPESLAKRFEVRKAVRESEGFEPLPADIRQLFPCEFEESELSVGICGFVPKGWAVSTTSEELVVKGGSTPSTKNLEFWENGDIHWTSPKDLSGNDTKIMLDTARKITSAGLKKITSGLLPVNTVLMSSRAPVGYLALAKVPVAINQGYIAIPSSKNLTSEYIIQWLDANMDEIKGVAGGTTFAEISKSTFKSLDIVIPNSEAVKAFTNIVNVNYERITDGVKQINALTKLRDTLLPKLISGELRLDSPQGEALQ